MKIQNVGGKVCLRCRGKTLLGIVNKLFVFKSLLTTSSNVLPLQLKQTFLPIIWIFTESEGDGIKSRLSSQVFFTLPVRFTGTMMYLLWNISINLLIKQVRSFKIRRFKSSKNSLKTNEIYKSCWSQSKKDKKRGIQVLLSVAKDNWGCFDI